ncbi:hypothetical protein LINPERHAP1_LOCUS42331 [Linum perenne]
MANSRDQANEECPKQMNSSSNQANKEGPKQMEEGSKQQIEEDSKQMAISSDHAEKEAISDNDEDDISKENLFMTRKRMQRKLSSGSSCYLSAQVHILETSCRKASKLKGASYLLMKDDDIMMSLISPLCLGGVGVSLFFFGRRSVEAEIWPEKAFNFLPSKRQRFTETYIFKSCSSEWVLRAFGF